MPCELLLKRLKLVTENLDVPTKRPSLLTPNQIILLRRHSPTIDLVRSYSIMSYTSKSQNDFDLNLSQIYFNFCLYLRLEEVPHVMLYFR